MKTNMMILWGGIMLAAALTSCDKNEEAAVLDNGQVRFTASISKEAVAKPQSRAAGTQWAAGDDIGIFMVNHGTNAIAEGSDNRQYTTLAGNGIFTPVLDNEIFYPMNLATTVDFIAYYPYQEGSKLGSTFPVKVSGTQTAASQAEIDMMWAKADNGGNGYTKENKTGVALNFSHRLSKLTMNCKLDPSIGVSSMPDDATVTIKGMYQEIEIAFEDARLIPINGTDDISPRRFDTAPTGFHAAYDAIIVPMSYAAGEVTVDFIINGEPFIWKVEGTQFESGSNHVYEVLITRTGIKATGSIQDWTTVVKGPVIAE